MAIRMGVQFGIFKQIVENEGHATTTEQISKASGASPVLVDQIMRMLASSGYVVEEDVGTYKPSALTRVIADSTIEATARACFDIGNMGTAKAPEFFRRNQNQFPGSSKETPFQLAMGTESDYFEWLQYNPDLAKDFQQWMTLKQRMILQDLPHVISNISNPPQGTELMSHDFFTAQPVQEARAYFMHWILHDWPDQQAREILKHIAAAMQPGYSRLIINEHIIPDRNCDLSSACMSIMMMVQVAAFERSEKQWRELIESAGLKVVAFHQPPKSGEGIRH